MIDTVEKARPLVDDGDLGTAEEHAHEGDELALSIRKPRADFGDLPAEVCGGEAGAVEEGDLVEDARKLGGLRGGRAESEVLPQRAVEQERAGRNVAEQAPQRRLVERPALRAVDENAAARRRGIALDRAQERALAAAVRPDEGDVAAAGNERGHAVDGGAPVLVLHGDVVERSEERRVGKEGRSRW